MAKPQFSRLQLNPRLSLDPKSWTEFKRKLKALEKATRKEIITKALMAGGGVIHAAAEARAPGPLELVIIGGRALKKRADPAFANILKSNAKVAAIGPDAEHWYYRFLEFGASPHDISVGAPNLFKGNPRGLIAFEDVVKAWAKQTGGVPAKPFLRPAMDQNGDAAVKAMARVLDAELKKVAAS